MRIGILTHPLKSNYGGILQAYALTRTLQKMGHEPVILHREPDCPVWKRAVIGLLRKLHFPRYYHPEDKARVEKLTDFVTGYFNHTAPIYSSRGFRRTVRKHGLEAVIVGSDQVWRADYAIHFGYDYFLASVPDDVIKASYAASFGLSEWKYNQQQTDTIKHLLKDFNGVSVREYDGAALCRKYLDVEPVVTVDPTLLLSGNDYDDIVSPRLVDKPYVFVYWLGNQEKLKEILAPYEATGQYQIVSVSLRDKTPLMSIGDWLSMIKYADLVVTDSFHGCVFSTIFRTQFIAHKNASGGTGRLASLFKILGMDEKSENPSSEVDYGEAYKVLTIRKEEALSYLNSVLT